MKRIDLDAAADKAVGVVFGRVCTKLAKFWSIAQYIVPVAVAVLTAWGATIMAKAEQENFNSTTTGKIVQINHELVRVDGEIRAHGTRLEAAEKFDAVAGSEHNEFRRTLVELRAIAARQASIEGKLDILIEFYNKKEK